MQVFCKFFSKTVRKQTKTRHNTCEACAGLYIAMSGLALGNLRRGFSVHLRRSKFVSVHSGLIKIFKKGSFIMK